MRACSIALMAASLVAPGSGQAYKGRMFRGVMAALAVVSLRLALQLAAWLAIAPRSGTLSGYYLAADAGALALAALIGLDACRLPEPDASERAALRAARGAAFAAAFIGIVFVALPWAARRTAREALGPPAPEASRPENAPSYRVEAPPGYRKETRPSPADPSVEVTLFVPRGAAADLWSDPDRLKAGAIVLEAAPLEPGQADDPRFAARFKERLEATVLEQGWEAKVTAVSGFAFPAVLVDASRPRHVRVYLLGNQAVYRFSSAGWSESLSQALRSVRE